MLFNSHTLIKGNAYRLLAAFRFEEALRLFDEARFGSTGDEAEIQRAIEACHFWRACGLIRENLQEQQVEKLYQVFSAFDFSRSNGLEQLKGALQNRIYSQMMKAGGFYFDDGTPVSDLLISLKKFMEAERIISHRMENHPDDTRLRYLLAQVLWLRNQKGRATKEYAQALFYNPCDIPVDRILSRQIMQLIDDEGPEMVLAITVVRSIIQPVPVSNEIEPCSEVHQNGIECYRLFRAAERAHRKGESENCYSLRKQLKEQFPGFYEEYYMLISNRGKRSL